MPEINSYSFGKMIINADTFANDLIILPDGSILPDWFRKSGHLLVPADLEPVLEQAPDKLIVGTGASGRMAVDPRVKEMTASTGITLIVEHTGKAVERYHQSTASGMKTAACFHLTC